MDDSVQVYVGKHLHRNAKMQKHKYFVFDLDETIGSFQDLYLLCNILNFVQRKCKKKMFENALDIIDDLLDLYIEFFRPGIFHILRYIHLKKKQKICDGFFIYTNNQCIPETWAKYIMDYLEKKLKLTNLVNNIVLSFKVNNKIVERKRTTQNKIYDEFVKCVLISDQSDICFVDNALYTKMKQDSVYYIQPSPYYHFLSFQTILNRFFDSGIGKKFLTSMDNSKVNITKMIMEKYKQNEKIVPLLNNAKNKNYYLDVSKKLMYHIREYIFFKNEKTPKTLKRRKNKKSGTRKCKLL